MENECSLQSFETSSVIIFLILGGMNPSVMVSHAEHTAHSDMCLSTHPRSLVLGAVGSYCTAPGEQWEWGDVRCLAQGHHVRAGGELGPLQVEVHTPYLGLVGDLTLQLPVQAPTD